MGKTPTSDIMGPQFACQGVSLQSIWWAAVHALAPILPVVASWDLSSPSTTDPHGTDALALSEPVSWPGETSKGDVLRLTG